MTNRYSSSPPRTNPYLPSSSSRWQEDYCRQQEQQIMPCPTRQQPPLSRWDNGYKSRSASAMTPCPTLDNTSSPRNEEDELAQLQKAKEQWEEHRRTIRAKVQEARQERLRQRFQMGVFSVSTNEDDSSSSSEEEEDYSESDDESSVHLYDDDDDESSTGYDSEDNSDFDDDTANSSLTTLASAQLCCEDFALEMATVSSTGSGHSVSSERKEDKWTADWKQLMAKAAHDAYLMEQQQQQQLLFPRTRSLPSLFAEEANVSPSIVHRSHETTTDYSLRHQHVFKSFSHPTRKVSFSSSPPKWIPLDEKTTTAQVTTTKAASITISPMFPQPRKGGMKRSLSNPLLSQPCHQHHHYPQQQQQQQQPSLVTVACNRWQ